MQLWISHFFSFINSFFLLFNTSSLACNSCLRFILISIFCAFCISFLVLLLFSKRAFNSPLPSETLSLATLKPHWIYGMIKADSIFWSSIFCSWAKPFSDSFLSTFNVASSFTFSSSFHFCSKWPYIIVSRY